MRSLLFSNLSAGALRLSERRDRLRPLALPLLLVLRLLVPFPSPPLPRLLQASSVPEQ